MCPAALRFSAVRTQLGFLSLLGKNVSQQTDLIAHPHFIKWTDVLPVLSYLTHGEPHMLLL